MKTSEQIIEIAQAMNHVQREMKPAIKDSTNPHFKSKYSDLSSVMEAIREPLGNHGLSVWQDATLDEHGVNITTRIVHISGQWVEFGPLTIPIGKKDAHAVGSACSYGKRYALCAALGVVSDDDDGNQAIASQEKKKDLPKMIEKHQCMELNTIIEQCDAEYQTNLWAYLTSQKISSFEEMDEKTFNKLKKGCLNNISQKFEHANC
jgi:ERF superfamily